MLKCYMVNCITDKGEIHSVGVMVENEEKAKESAVSALLEGRHIVARAVSVTEVDAI